MSVDIVSINQDARSAVVLGLINDGTTCFYNSVLQALASCPPIHEWLRGILLTITSTFRAEILRRKSLLGSEGFDVHDHLLEDNVADRICSLAADTLWTLKLLSQTYLNKQSAPSPVLPSRTATDFNEYLSTQNGTQHDAHEMLGAILTAISDPIDISDITYDGLYDCSDSVTDFLRAFDRIVSLFFRPDTVPTASAEYTDEKLNSISLSTDPLFSVASPMLPHLTISNSLPLHGPIQHMWTQGPLSAPCNGPTSTHHPVPLPLLYSSPGLRTPFELFIVSRIRCQACRNYSRIRNAVATQVYSKYRLAMQAIDTEIEELRRDYGELSILANNDTVTTAAPSLPSIEVHNDGSLAVSDSMTVHLPSSGDDQRPVGTLRRRNSLKMRRSRPGVSSKTFQQKERLLLGKREKLAVAMETEVDRRVSIVLDPLAQRTAFLKASQRQMTRGSSYAYRDHLPMSDFKRSSIHSLANPTASGRLIDCFDSENGRIFPHRQDPLNDLRILSMCPGDTNLSSQRYSFLPLSFPPSQRDSGGSYFSTPQSLFGLLAVFFAEERVNWACRHSAGNAEMHTPSTSTNNSASDTSGASTSESTSESAFSGSLFPNALYSTTMGSVLRLPASYLPKCGGVAYGLSNMGMMSRDPYSAVKTTHLLTCPPVLFLNIQRRDPFCPYGLKKISTPLTFGPMLDLKCFTLAEESRLSRESDTSTGLTSETSQRMQHNAASSPVDDTTSFSVESDPRMPKDRGGDTDYHEHKSALYELMAVVVHIGKHASAGHYITYRRIPTPVKSMVTNSSEGKDASCKFVPPTWVLTDDTTVTPDTAPWPDDELQRMYNPLIERMNGLRTTPSKGHASRVPVLTKEEIKHLTRQSYMSREEVKHGVYLLCYVRKDILDMDSDIYEAELSQRLRHYMQDRVSATSNSDTYGTTTPYGLSLSSNTDTEPSTSDDPETPVTDMIAPLPPRPVCSNEKHMEIQTKRITRNTYIDYTVLRPSYGLFSSLPTYNPFVQGTMVQSPNHDASVGTGKKKKSILSSIFSLGNTNSRELHNTWELLKSSRDGLLSIVTRNEGHPLSDNLYQYSQLLSPTQCIYRDSLRTFQKQTHSGHEEYGAKRDYDLTSVFRYNPIGICYD